MNDSSDNLFITEFGTRGSPSHPQNLRFAQTSGDPAVPEATMKALRAGSATVETVR